ncbi:unnamed protein product [Allacma fusca]|uniref:Uncharacterized protein n=1 Tax=Allacma fusca TaxID=39272 RepID=A0A8J2P4V7_9HEXA|nr:unnamed protein product [Allacma fusca]
MYPCALPGDGTQSVKNDINDGDRNIYYAMMYANEPEALPGDGTQSVKNDINDGDRNIYYAMMYANEPEVGGAIKANIIEGGVVRGLINHLQDLGERTSCRSFIIQEATTDNPCSSGSLSHHCKPNFLNYFESISVVKPLNSKLIVMANCRKLLSCLNCTSIPQCVWTPDNAFPCRNGFDDTDEMAFDSCDVARKFSVRLGEDESIKHVETEMSRNASNLWGAAVCILVVAAGVMLLLYVAYKQRREFSRRRRALLFLERSRDVMTEPFAIQMVAISTASILNNNEDVVTTSQACRRVLFPPRGFCNMSAVLQIFESDVFFIRSSFTLFTKL